MQPPCQTKQRHSSSSTPPVKSEFHTDRVNHRTNTSEERISAARSNRSHLNSSREQRRLLHDTTTALLLTEQKPDHPARCYVGQTFPHRRLVKEEEEQQQSRGTSTNIPYCYCGRVLIPQIICTIRRRYTKAFLSTAQDKVNAVTLPHAPSLIKSSPSTCRITRTEQNVKQSMSNKTRCVVRALALSVGKVWAENTKACRRNSVSFQIITHTWLHASTTKRSLTTSWGSSFNYNKLRRKKRARKGVVEVAIGSPHSRHSQSQAERGCTKQHNNELRSPSVRRVKL